MKQNINLITVGLLLAGAGNGFGQPTITQQPADQSVSLGANVTNQVRASGTAPLNYQWHFNGMQILGATNRTLVLTNVQLTHAGTYAAIVSDTGGSVTSRVATLTVDPTFTKITTGPVVSEGGSSVHGAWADYDGDGYLDLFVSNGTFGAGTGEANFLYRNSGDGTFTKVTTGVIVSEPVDSSGGAWGDYDNDGYPDLFVPNKVLRNDLLYRNNGDGSFTKILTGSVVTNGQFASGGAAWADFDNDGYLDLYVPVSNIASQNRLYRNNGDGTFGRMTNNPVVTEHGRAPGAAWGDYDNDGNIDLFVCRNDDQNNSLYRNTGHESFTRISAGSIVNDGGFSIGSSWADYDNDGFFDLFVANDGPVPAANFLYHNNGDGNFTRITNNIAARELGNWAVGAWGDYDNDGFIDLFVTDVAAKNALYHNNGDGSFTKITAGSPANDIGSSFGCSWGDYDNDGFLDLFVANRDSRNNFLYRNNDNSNAWLKVKLVGTQSNRSGIGAKLRVTAKIRGNSIRQLRQISGGGFGQSTLLAHFGLGDATNIDTVRIEWPSGTVQEFHDVEVKQFLTVTEPPRLEAGGQLPDGSFQLLLTGGVGFRYDIETSSDLKMWTPWIKVTNTNRTVSINDPAATKSAQRFYRAVGQ
jgi:enediyne biosynthesis protein E4